MQHYRMQYYRIGYGVNGLEITQKSLFFSFSCIDLGLESVWGIYGAAMKNRHFFWVIKNPFSPRIS